ncbi:hypothetical protein PAN31117_05094 [Pandoraea anapnoica]|uniref:Uncharacterized protein n=1 Tax=Pandoraea anapnoica TaxID=2508301 RepID=A0A5E5AN70_9BURK|nr:MULTISPECIES: hypothetical protein [Pandoraea]VVE58477.1 hypothetical protein PIN31009_05306 [Pandoraea iniqua]VVE75149.1 hypothetical protein PAN31117_05094 [Pandoraea anapnoica]
MNQRLHCRHCAGVFAVEVIAAHEQNCAEARQEMKAAQSERLASGERGEIDPPAICPN